MFPKKILLKKIIDLFRRKVIYGPLDAPLSYLFLVKEKWIVNYRCSTELCHPLHFIYVEKQTHTYGGEGLNITNRRTTFFYSFSSAPAKPVGIQTKQTQPSLL